MTCQVILEFKAKPDAIEDVRSFLRGTLPDTRGYVGCVGLHVSQNQDDPTAFVIVAQWDSREIYETYLQGRVDSGTMDKLGDMLDGETTIRFFNYSGV
jgi:quinol monooxygenase YgiN